ncbi:MAG: Lrp/AsnC family transcriptional regulator [Bacteroidetes bacterium]|jgi:Lrp/AsnC family leucine-responsive transcriptional regulator|nr:Lrp/AsnC family transcriptional regulator [Bacteroidota bacterium]
MKLDNIDLKILRILQQQGRITNVLLSSEIGLSPAPTLERVKKLEQAGYIQSYHARINPELLNLNVMIIVEISLNIHQDANIEAFMAEIRKIPEIVECYHVTGDADFLLKVFVRDMSEYQRLVNEKISKVPHLGRIQSRVVMGVVKDQQGVPVPGSVEVLGK